MYIYNNAKQRTRYLTSGARRELFVKKELDIIDSEEHRPTTRSDEACMKTYVHGWEGSIKYIHYTTLYSMSIHMKTCAGSLA